jgi:protein-tyrosine phosphatase
MTVLFLCTDNAARSVIAGAALSARLPGVVVETAGTLSVDGLPMSSRTRGAVRAVGLPVPRHRSGQGSTDDLERAQLVVGLAPEHVAWVRRTHPPAAARTGTLARLACDLPGTSGPLVQRVAALDLARQSLEPWQEVIDPGGGDAATFAACAQIVVGLVDGQAAALGAAGVRRVAARRDA